MSYSRVSPDDRPPTLNYADPFVVPWWATWRGIVTITVVSWVVIGSFLLLLDRGYFGR